MEFFGPMIRLSNVRDVLADAWDPSFKVLLRDSTKALSETPVSLRSGDLIRVLHPGAAHPRLTSVEAM